MINNLYFETKRMLRQSQTAYCKLQRIRKETLNFLIRKLTRSKTGDRYGDKLNKTLCLLADELEISLPEAETAVRERIDSEISDTDIEEYLLMTLKEQKEKRLRNLLLKNASKFEDPEKAIALTSILFEIEQRETDKVWGTDKLKKILVAGLNREKVNLITMLCLINQFDYKGGYVSNPDLFAYLKNPKLEAVPLIIDEMTLLINFFAFYGIDASLTIYVSDTDYTEIGEFGPVNDANIQNIRKYIQNLRNYLKDKPKVEVVPVSDITNGNPIYQEIKKKVLDSVKRFKDFNFTREWYQKFEDDFEKRFESQSKRGLFSPKEIRQKTLELTRNIWACNAAQGAVFGTLNPNTILVSTERRERDRNYTIDESSREKFPPIIYVLKAAEIWNRKIVQKGT